MYYLKYLHNPKIIIKVNDNNLLLYYYLQKNHQIILQMKELRHYGLKFFLLFSLYLNRNYLYHIYHND